MILVVLLVGLLSQALGQDLDVTSACIKDNNLNATVVLDHLTGLILPEEDVDGLYVFIVCFARKSGIINDSDEINWERVESLVYSEFKTEPDFKSFLTPEHVKTAVSECKNKNLVDNNPGRTNVRAHNCVVGSLLAVKHMHTAVKCGTEVNIDVNAIDIDKTVILPEDIEALHNFATCYLRTYGIVNSNDEFIWAAMQRAIATKLEVSAAKGNSHFLTPINQKNIKDAVSYCKDKKIVGKNIGHTSILLNNCIINNIKKQSQLHIIQTCIAQKKVNVSVIEQYMHELLVPENVEEVVAVSSCLCHKIGIIDKDDQINWELYSHVYSDFKAYFGEIEPDFANSVTVERVNDAVLTCKGENITGKNIGQTVVKVHNCIITTLKAQDDLHIIDTCIKETNQNASTIKSYINNLILPEDSDELNTFIECYTRKLGVIKNSNEIKWDNVVLIISSAFQTYFKHIDPDFVKSVTTENAKDALLLCKDKDLGVKNLGLVFIKLQNCVINTLKMQNHIRITKKCIKEDNLNADTIMAYMKNLLAPEDADDLATFSTCYSREVGAITSDNKINWDMYLRSSAEFKNYFVEVDPAFVKPLTTEKVKAALLICKDKNLTAQSIGHTTLKLHNCMINTLKAQSHIGITEKCIKDNKLDADTIIAYMKNLLVPEDADDLAIFSTCYSRQVGATTMDNKINWDVFLSSASDFKAHFSEIDPVFIKPLTTEIIKAAVLTCKHKNITAKSIGHTTLKLHNCIINTLKAQNHIRLTEKCIKENKLNADTIIAYMKNLLLPEDADDLATFSTCYSHEIGTITIDNEINWDALLRTSADFKTYFSEIDPAFVKPLTTETVKAAVLTCKDKNITAKTIGHTTLKLHNCVINDLKAQNHIRISEKCIKENQLITESITTQMKDLLFSEDDDNFATFSACYCREVGAIDNDDEINWDVYLRSISMFQHYFNQVDPSFARLQTPELTKSAILACKAKNLTAKSVGRTTLKLHNCIINTLKAFNHQQITEECIKENNLNAEAIRSHFANLILPEDDNEVDTFSTCYGRKIEIVSEDDQIKWDHLQKKLASEYKSYYERIDPDFVRPLTPETIKEAVQVCKGKSLGGKNIGQTSTKINNCIINTLKDASKL